MPPAGCPGRPPSDTQVVPNAGVATPAKPLDGFDNKIWIFGHSRWQGVPGVFNALQDLAVGTEVFREYAVEAGWQWKRLGARRMKAGGMPDHEIKRRRKVEYAGLFQVRHRDTESLQKAKADSLREWKNKGL